MTNVSFPKIIMLDYNIDFDNRRIVLTIASDIYFLFVLDHGKMFSSYFFFVTNIDFCYQRYFFSHITQHSIQNITKQNNRHILNISKSSQKGGREGRTIKTQKSLLYIITYIKQKTLPSING